MPQGPFSLVSPRLGVLIRNEMPLPGPPLAFSAVLHDFVMSPLTDLFILAEIKEIKLCHVVLLEVNFVTQLFAR